MLVSKENCTKSTMASCFHWNKWFWNRS